MGNIWGAMGPLQPEQQQQLQQIQPPETLQQQQQPQPQQFHPLPPPQPLPPSLNPNFSFESLRHHGSNFLNKASGIIGQGLEANKDLIRESIAARMTGRPISNPYLGSYNPPYNHEYIGNHAYIGNHGMIPDHQNILAYNNPQAQYSPGFTHQQHEFIPPVRASYSEEGLPCCDHPSMIESDECSGSNYDDYNDHDSIFPSEFCSSAIASKASKSLLIGVGLIIIGFFTL